LYTGVTNNLLRRMEEHKNKINPKSFSARYNIEKLVWFENYTDIGEAIDPGKTTKSWAKKEKDSIN